MGRGKIIKAYLTHVALSWAVGMVAATFFFWPVRALLGPFNDDFLPTMAVGLVSFPIMLFPMFLFGPFVSWPLVMIGAMVGFLAKHPVCRWPVYSAMFAASVASIIVAAWMAYVRDNAWASKHSFSERFLFLLLEEGNILLFSLPIFVGALFFAWRLPRVLGDPK